MEKYRLNPTEGWFLDAQHYYNDAVRRLEDEVDRLEDGEHQLRFEVKHLRNAKSQGYSNIMYSSLPEQQEFPNGGFGGPFTKSFRGQIEKNEHSVLYCCI
ncbi:hypothetical protein RHMOL_Rhmol11G0112300 [Rhododendron molle]|uniref:Uncharacterized protein n=1 Tax=Rhododendron molle TaxID=49168 RepID=A0ACC0LS20_RHOML|nr:hypothetical protein RHMOL_Rhmol11G0112300 [Rhododendron molle]